MGHVVEGSGGLVLQMTLDRRVVVFGRGRVLVKHDFPKRRRQTSGASRNQKAVEVAAEADRDAAGTGERRERDSSGQNNSSSGDDDSLTPLSKWSMHGRRKA